MPLTRAAVQQYAAAQRGRFPRVNAASRPQIGTVQQAPVGTTAPTNTPQAAGAILPSRAGVGPNYRPPGRTFLDRNALAGPPLTKRQVLANTTMPMPRRNWSGQAPPTSYPMQNSSPLLPVPSNGTAKLPTNLTSSGTGTSFSSIANQILPPTTSGGTSALVTGNPGQVATPTANTQASVSAKSVASTKDGDGPSGISASTPALLLVAVILGVVFFIVK